MIIILVFSVIFVTLTTLYMKTRRPSNCPPGPPTVPFIGNLNLDMKNMLQTLRECRRKYGDIFSLILGKETVVVVCGQEKLQEVFVENGEASSHRPCSFLFSELLTSHGIVGSNGKVWSSLRSALLSFLRSRCTGQLLEENILTEVKVLQRKLEDTSGLPFDITNLVHVSVSNVICSFVFGKRYDHENETFVDFTKVVTEITSKPDVVGLLTFFPFLKYLPFDIMGTQKLKSAFNSLRDFCRHETLLHKRTCHNGKIRDIIDYFIKMQTDENGPDFEIKDEMITEVITEIFGAGSDSSSTTIRWFLLFMIKHPDVQQNMRQEILQNIGMDIAVTMQDRCKLNYCQAVILETLRVGTAAPFSLPHMASRDINLHDDIIPKGAYILPNLDSINHNEEEFENPDEFNPMRFLDTCGNLIKTKTILPFSVGRRICPGESLAKKLIFLLSTNIVQSFDLFPAKKEDTEPGFSFGLTYAPKSFKLTAVSLRTETLS